MAEQAGASRARTPNAKSPRRTQVERTAATRRKVLDAAIQVLHEQGYSKTTIGIVAETAGVSRGAMLHHFRSKAALISAVVEDVLGTTQTYFRQRIGEYDDPIERFLALPRIAWDLFRQPQYFAWIEIWTATRRQVGSSTTRATASRLLFRESVVRLAREAGVSSAVHVESLHVMARATVTGLAMDLTIDGNETRCSRAVDQLRYLLERLVRR